MSDLLFRHPLPEVSLSLPEYLPIFTDLAEKARIMLSACACTSGVMIQLIRNTSASTTLSIRFPFPLLLFVSYVLGLSFIAEW